MSNEEEIRIREDKVSAGAPPADIEVQHPADAAETIEGLDIAEQVKFIKQVFGSERHSQHHEMEPVVVASVWYE